jgi:uncharacterized protein YcaQ
MYDKKENEGQGYFVMPVLHNGKLIGRMDPKADRKNQVMKVKSLTLEKGVKVTREVTTAVSNALMEFAEFHECDKIELGKGVPKLFLKQFS